MKKLQFSIDIDAPSEKVWKTLWEDATYPRWTKVFSEGSRAVSDWQEGSKVLFLSGSGEGMSSIIARNKPNEFMSFRHVGEVKEGKEVPSNAETEKWSGAMENYTLRETGGVTQLSVEVDVLEDHESYFQTTFPKALESVKEIAEH